MQRIAKPSSSTKPMTASPAQHASPLTGRPLSSALRSDMERAFGHDFSTVRVLEDHRARSYGALAFARGDRLHFKPGLYQPETQHGRRLIAHELAHVVQQRAKRVPVGAGLRGEINRDRGLEVEAHLAGDLVAEGQSARSLFGGEAAHASGCGCGQCASAPLVAAPTVSPSPVQLAGPCDTCGGNHDTTDHAAFERRRIAKKIQDEKHQQAALLFNQGKRETVARLRQEEKEPVAKNFKELDRRKQEQKASTKFTQKHTTQGSLAHAAKAVAETRTFGGGRQEGRSTVIAMTPQERHEEERFQVEGLKMSEAEVDESGEVKSKFGVNKPTKRDYPTVTATVTTGPDGKRVVKMGDEKVAKPVLGKKGDEFAHLEGVQDNDDD